MLVLLNNTTSLDTIHLRHHHIQQNQINIRRPRAFFFAPVTDPQQFQHLFGGGRRNKIPVVFFFEDLTDNDYIGGIIIYD
ncbi:hypothetical protein D3C71_1987010 [compost metagenome]